MKQESGRSMIEMLGVLAIMGVITAGAYLMIANGMRMIRGSSVSEEVFQIVSRVRDIHRGFDNFSNLNGNTIFGAIGMSDTNPYGGKYEVMADPSNPRQFIVSITGLSRSDCEYFVNKAWTDSVGYEMSGHKNSGATGNCSAADGKNVVQITYGE